MGQIYLNFNFGKLFIIYKSVQNILHTYFKGKFTNYSSNIDLFECIIISFGLYFKLASVSYNFYDMIIILGTNGA